MRDEILIDITHPVVRDHAVHGKHLFPGLAYVDLLYQLLRDHGFSYREMELRSLAIYRPLIVDEQCDVLLEIAWEQKAEDRWQVMVEGTSRCNSMVSGPRQLYVTAQMVRVGPADFPDVIDLDALWDKAEATVKAEEIYHQWSQRGLTHTGLMKAQGLVRVVGSVIYADLTAGEDSLASTSHLLFHPGLLDGSLVVASGALQALPSAQAEGGLRLPLSFGSFRAATTLQDHCVARLSLDSLRQKTGLSYLTIEFFNAAGRKVAELKDLASQPWIEPRPEKVETALPQPDVARTVRRIIAQKLKLPEHAVRTTANFSDLGLVSSDLLACAQAIEVSLDRPLSPTLLFEYTTLDELSAHLGGREALSSQRHAVPVRAENPQPLLPVRAADDADIAIIGIAGRFPGAENMEQFWENLKSGQDCITEIPEDRWDHRPFYDVRPDTPGKTDCKWGGFLTGMDQFDPLFFNISPREAELMDPQGRLFLETVWNVLEASGYTRATLRDRYRKRVGVYVGAMYLHYRAAEAQLDASAITSLFSYSAIANRVSYFFGLEGPSLAIDTMCSSSMTALHTACQDLRSGECELAIAGGVNLSLHPGKYVGLSQAHLIGSDANSRSFAQGNGYLPAEAVGAVLLKPLSRAVQDQDRILAVIKATGVNHGGRSNGYSVPNPNVQAQLIEQVIRKAGVDAAAISYVEAAANGSATGDLVEWTALNRAFAAAGQHGPCPIGSVKTNIGHAEAASGISQLAKVVLQMQHGMLVPCIKTDPGNRNLRWDDSAFSLQRELGEWKRTSEGEPRRALINSFGAGGAYAAMVLEEYLPNADQPAMETCGPQLVVFSARTKDRLRAVMQQLLAHIERSQCFSLADFARTLQLGREAMESRLAMIVNDRDQLVEAIRGYLQEPWASTVCHGSVPVMRGETDAASPVGDLISGKLRDVVINTLLEEQDLAKLGLLWTLGVDIRWDSLEPGAARQMVGLPTYPFARRRCWIELLGSNAHAEPAASFVEPGVKIDRDSETATVRGQVLDFLLAFLEDSLKISTTDVNPARNLQAYGFDSLIAMRLVRALEAHLGIHLTGRELLEHASLDALCDYCTARIEGGNQPSLSEETGQSAEQALELFRRGELSLQQMEDLINQGAIA